MAGSITVTTSDDYHGVTRFAIAWICDAGGAVSGNSFNVRPGELLQVQFSPGAPAPTDQYDVTLTDANGADVLAGTGANQSATAPAYAVPAVSTYFRRTLEAGALTPVVANAGATKAGLIVLLVR